MAMVAARGKLREGSIEATITRADGTVEHLGVISYYHRNPLKRWLWHFRRRLESINDDRSNSK